MTARKAVQAVEVKDSEEGRVRAVVATLGVKDKDGDLIERGAFGTQDVKVSAFNHGSWEGALPVGRGTVTESGEKAIFDGRFFMDTTHGQDAFRTVKGLAELGEWSFGFDVASSRQPSDGERDRGIVRVLEDLEVHEVSPVLRGAGVDTGTLAAKCDACGVREAAADPEMMEGARRTIQKADEALREDGPLTVKRHPDRDVQGLAEFAVQTAYALVGYPGLPYVKGPPKVRWFIPSGRTTGHMNPAKHKIHLSLDLRGEKLAHTALHEVRHMAQADPRAPGAEEDAESFARRWSGAVVAAHRTTSGDAYRVVVKDGRPPFYGDRIRSGSVVLSRSNGRVYDYRPRHTTAWKELST